MSGPWDQFAATSTPEPAPAAPAAGPWAQYGGAAPAAAPQAPLRGADAIPGSAADQRRSAGLAPAPVAPPVAPPSVGAQIIGAVEAGLNLATSLTTGALGMAGGFVTNLAEGTAAVTTAADRKSRGLPAQLPGGPGMQPEQLPSVERSMTEGAQALTYEPRTELGVERAEQVGGVMANLIPLTGHLGEMGAMSSAAGPAKQAVKAKVAASDARSAAAKLKADKLEAPTLRGVREANEAGFTLTPSETKQGGTTGAVAGAAEGLSGEPKLAKAASKKNAEVTNSLVRQDVGLPDDTPVSRDALRKVRADAGEKYEVLKKIDTIDNDATYFRDLDEVTKAYDTAAESFPHRNENPFQKVIDGLRQERVTGAAAVEEVKLLRADADKQYATGDKALGRAYRDAANALDNSIDRHLTKMVDQGADPALATAVDEYRAARKTIAKSYLADAALNDTTGNIDAAAYARALKKGAPLSGPGLQIARAAQQFPRMFQKVEKLGNTGAPTIMDAGMALLGGSKEALMLGARPGARAALLSKPVQKMLTERARKAKPAPKEPPAPPPEPTTSPGAGPGTPPKGGGGSPGPLGDLTPDWETTPGAAPSERVPTVDATDLHRAVGEPPVTTGNPKSRLEIPAVPGRPDLPDVLTAGGPAEIAATERAARAMQEPGAIEARASQAEVALRRENDALRKQLGIPVGETAEGQPPIKGERPGKIPVGKVIEGQPEIKVEPRDKVPVGEATEIVPERVKPAPEPIPTAETYEMTPEQAKAWQAEFKLGDGDAQRAKDVARALGHDAEAVEAAAVQHDNNPRAFDREIARIIDEGEARANESQQPARGSESDAAGAQSDRAAAAAAPDQRPGADRAAASAAERGEARTAGRQEAARPVEPPDEVFSESKPETFYSPLTRAVEGLKQGKGTPGDWNNILKGLTTKGVKPEEIEWSGVRDWLAAQGKQVTKAEVVEFLKQGGVKVEEVQKGGAGSVSQAMREYLRDGGYDQPDSANAWLAQARDAELSAKQWQRNGDKTKAQQLFDLADEANEMAERLETDSGNVHGATKYSQYQLPGGENYREVLLTLPIKSGGDPAKWNAVLVRERSPITGKPEFEVRDEGGNPVTRVHTAINAEEALKIAARGREVGQTVAPNTYRSPHWDEPNVLAHIRLNDRIDAQGRRVLFVEEVQSDWAQQGKRVGFKTPADEAAIAEGKAKYAELKKQYDELEKQRDVARDVVTKEARRLLKETHPGLYEYADILRHRDREALTTKYRELQKSDEAFQAAKADEARIGQEQTKLYEQMSAAEAPEQASRTKIPAAPFVGKTDAWTALAIKRIAKMAADEGYDRVAFVNGEQSAARYDLSKQIDRIDHSKNSDGTYNLSAIKNGEEVFSKEDMKPGEIEDHVGKEVAQKIINGEGKPFTEHDPVNRWEADDSPHNAKDFDYGKTQPRTLAGLDLKVGGEGMKAFYDKIVPNVAKDVVRKLGGDGLTEVKLSTGDRFEAMKQAREDSGLTRNEWERLGSAEQQRRIDEVLSDSNGKQLGFDITDRMREQTANGVPLFKQGGQGKPVGSPEAMHETLRAKFGDKLINGLVDQGILKFALARDEGMVGNRAGVKAVMREGRNPAATLYVDRLTADAAPGVLMHELGEHFGIVRLLGQERYDVMLNELKSQRNAPEVREAWAEVKRSYTGEDTASRLAEGDPRFLREVAARLVETHPDLPLVRRIVNEIRAFFYEHFGTTLGSRVDANLIRGLAAAALRKASEGDLPKMKQPVRMLVPRTRPTPTGAMRPIQ